MVKYLNFGFNLGTGHLPSAFFSPSIQVSELILLINLLKLIIITKQAGQHKLL